MLLKVQQYLENKTLLDLEIEHGVYASFNKTGEYFSLNYDMIESRENDPLSQECRGLILSKIDGSSFLPEAKTEGGKTIYKHLCPGTTRVLCFGMKRFFNYGQGSCAPINWTDPNLKVLEKLDGSLCQVWHNPFNNTWNVATRSCPDADLLMDNRLFTFRSLFERALEETTKGLPFDQFTNFLDKNITYCFELTTPYNRIVCNYPDCRITLLAARKLSNFKEINPFTIKSMDTTIPIVQAYTYTSVEELVNWVSSLDPLNHEGVVVIDSHFNRVKVKNAAYCAFNRCRDTLAASPRNCLELILLGRDDDVVPFMPQEIANNLLSIKKRYRTWLAKEEQMYQQVLQEAVAISPGDKKTFALTLNKYNAFSSAYFSIFAGKTTSIKDFIDKNRKEGTWSAGFLDRILEMI